MGFVTELFKERFIFFTEFTAIEVALIAAPAIADPAAPIDDTAWPIVPVSRQRYLLNFHLAHPRPGLIQLRCLLR
jgi:hypothetical protein